MTETKEIVVVDDLHDNVNEIATLAHRAGCRYPIRAFSFEEFSHFVELADQSASVEKKPETEELLSDHLQSKYSSTALLAVDHELSRAGRLLTDSAIVEVASGLAIPVARYHRESTPGSESLFFRAFASPMAAVKVPFDGQIGEQLCELADGFQQLHYRVANLDLNELKHQPARVLAEALGAPGLSLMFEEYLTARSFFRPEALSSSDKVRTLATRVGYWLYNVILRYPGLILNEISAASYVGIDPSDFRKEEVSNIFSDAEYRGPFASHTRYWWRFQLDDILEGEEGVDVVKKRTGKSVRECVCSITDRAPAGFYDLASGKPVSREESVGELQWIPKGADLARVNTETYEEVAPLR